MSLASCGINMKKHLNLFLGILSIGLVSCSSDQPSNPSHPSEELLPADSTMNVSYGNHPQQVYDIYLPKGRSSEYTKVAILIHGGSWTGGDKSDMNIFIPLMREKFPHHAIVNMNYVLATAENPAFPHQFLDVGRVIEQMETKKEELQILPEFGLVGVSAGGHLSLQYDYVYDTDDRVKMVCSIVGPTNLTDSYYQDETWIDAYYPVLIDESAYPENTDYAASISPALQVSADSSPTIMFYGNQDTLVPISNAYFLESKLIEFSVPHQLSVYDGGHLFDWSTTNFEDMETKLTSFIETHFEVAIPLE